MNASRARLLHVTLREALFLAIAAMAAVAFLQHENFYLAGPFAWREASLPSYVIVTTVVYVFVRTIAAAAMYRAPRVRAGLELCPECGQPLDDGTPRGLEAHYRVEVTPKPTDREIMAAVALRKAIDDARAYARARWDEDAPAAGMVRGDLENVSPEILKAVEEFDRWQGMRRGVREPRSPKGPR